MRRPSAAAGLHLLFPPERASNRARATEERFFRRCRWHRRRAGVRSRSAGARIPHPAKVGFAPNQERLHTKFKNAVRGAASFECMRLADRIAQSRTPFVVQSLTDGALTRLSGASDFAADVAQCPARYVLSDELTRLCTALAYSKGARNLECADLLRVPSERIWVEWCEGAWLSELERYGFRPPPEYVRRTGRRGALIRAS